MACIFVGFGKGVWSMEVICLGFLLGIVFSIIVLGVSVWIVDKRYNNQDKTEQ